MRRLPKDTCRNTCFCSLIPKFSFPLSSLSSISVIEVSDCCCPASITLSGRRQLGHHNRVTLCCLPLTCWSDDGVGKKRCRTWCSGGKVCCSSNQSPSFCTQPPLAAIYSTLTMNLQAKCASISASTRFQMARNWSLGSRSSRSTE